MKMKKVLLALAMILGLTSCGINGTKPNSQLGGSEGTSECENGVCGGGANINLDAINEYFINDPIWTNMNSNGNTARVIPFTHINGPKAEWQFFAVVNFEYNAQYYYKYQL